jgi:hypothetical protein
MRQKMQSLIRPPGSLTGHHRRGGQRRGLESKQIGRQSYPLEPGLEEPFAFGRRQATLRADDDD